MAFIVGITTYKYNGDYSLHAQGSHPQDGEGENEVRDLANNSSGHGTDRNTAYKTVLYPLPV
jgi:hypothetical protein